MKITLICLLLYFTDIYSQSWQRIQVIPEDMINFIYSDGDTLYTATDSLIYISRDNGSEWSILSGQNPFYTVTMIRINNILFAGTSGNGVYKSSDGGFSWESFNIGLSAWGKNVVQFYLMNNKLYLASDGGGVYYLDLTNPINWIEYNENLPSLVAWTVICMTGSKNNLIISSGANGLLHIRPDGASEWNSYYLDSLRRPQAWSLLSFSDYVFAGTGRVIYRSSDYGFTWDSVGISAIALRSSVLKSFGSTIYAGITRISEFWIWTSSDSGLNWNVFDHQFYNLTDLHITDDHIFAATQEGLWRYARNPVNVNDVNNNFSKEINVSVYPNPFNSAAIIETVIPEDGFTQLVIYNTIGEKRAELYNGEIKKGIYKYRFDGRHLSGGVYICLLNVNGKPYSKKIILLK